MKGEAIAFLAGGLFAVGLVISGMTQPAKILGFLEVRGNWDGSLMVVMVAAIAVHLPLVRLARARNAAGRTPRFGASFHWPHDRAIDAKLVAGAAIFGIGWGLSGYCPGPAVVSLVAGGAPLLVFVGALLAGLYATRAFVRD